MKFNSETDPLNGSDMGTFICISDIGITFCDYQYYIKITHRLDIDRVFSSIIIAIIFCFLIFIIILLVVVIITLFCENGRTCQANAAAE